MQWRGSRPGTCINLHFKLDGVSSPACGSGLGQKVKICEQQDGLVPSRSSSGAMFAVRMLLEENRASLEEAYDGQGAGGGAV